MKYISSSFIEAMGGPALGLETTHSRAMPKHPIHMRLGSKDSHFFHHWARTPSIPD